MLALLLFALLPGFDLASHERPRLVAAADAALQAEPRTIVAARNPRSAGGPQDFSSEGDYWWPDPNNPNGPYVQRDGLTNPDNFVAHRQLLLAFARHVGHLTAAYRATGDERYAVGAVRHLRAWFVTPTTRMHPHLRYAQAIKGLNTGRSIGVIDTVHLAEVALAVEALRGSKSLPAADDAAITGWFRDYLHWLTTDRFGLEESATRNNHATCAWLQRACFARLVGDATELAACRREFKEVLLPHQMAADGSFPEEVRRTKPYGYSIFNLDVMCALAVVCSTSDENLMTWSLPDGRSLVRGVTWLAPFLADKQLWLRTVRRPAGPKDPPGTPAKFVAPDVMYWDAWPIRQPALLFGAVAAGRRDWLALWQSLPADPTIDEVIRNYPIREPLLWLPR
ncbi:alginate lyase family protein [Opitutus sp. ER46]|uniref:alginate lyase family protein n=1 Tax=Opitutus sp. ER46 TaxID=2161864 RepID=UPI000D3164AF|nr:alginate lyase family protein [Opitutus sp. ER46]PTX94500.1 alginate lyase [Opitutus sp. ER46]